MEQLHHDPPQIKQQLQPLKLEHHSEYVDKRDQKSVPEEHTERERESSFSIQILCWIVNESKKGCYDHITINSFPIIQL